MTGPSLGLTRAVFNPGSWLLVLMTDELQASASPYLEHLYIYVPWGVPPVSM